MKSIPLTKNKVAIVDDFDYEALASHKWYFGVLGYPERRLPKNEGHNLIRMHTQIAGVVPTGMLVDHINGDKLDNRRTNLRVCTKSQNMLNRGKTLANKSGYKGVHHEKWSGRWKAQLKVNNKYIYIGRFDTAIAAADAYNRAALLHAGEFAKLNELHEIPN